jgi:hypothetical protein
MCNADRSSRQVWRGVDADDLAKKIDTSAVFAQIVREHIDQRNSRTRSPLESKSVIRRQPST